MSTRPTLQTWQGFYRDRPMGAKSESVARVQISGALIPICKGRLDDDDVSPAILAVSHGKNRRRDAGANGNVCSSR